MWHGVYFKSATNQRMDTSFAVNAIKKSLLLFFSERGESSKSYWMEKYFNPMQPSY